MLHIVHYIPTKQLQSKDKYIAQTEAVLRVTDRSRDAHKLSISQHRNVLHARMYPAYYVYYTYIHIRYDATRDII